MEEAYTKEDFLREKDFMKLGRSLSAEQWQAAAMTAQRMLKNAGLAGAEEFLRPLQNLRQCILSKRKNEALNALALLTQKRVFLLREIGIVGEKKNE